MPWWVYIIDCESDRLYTGISTDPQRRFEQHRQGRGARFTRMYPPRQLLAAVACTTRSEASREEFRIKALSRMHKLGWVAAHPWVESCLAPGDVEC
ncbi:MAG: GIY-YIG nuclease family protein [Pseudomonadales bacterium]|nr:GIY-YIG nuclease family protein [Pseudomonadales bacterium]